MLHLHHTYATTTSQIREAISSYREWIENRLGLPLSEAVILDSDGDLYKSAITRFLGYADPDSRIDASIAGLMHELSSAEAPAGHITFLDLSKERAAKAHQSLATVSETTFAYSAEWVDGPVLLRMRSLSFPIVAVSLCHRPSPESHCESRQAVLVLPKHGLQDYLKFLKHVSRPVKESRLKVWNGESHLVTPCFWDDLVLDPEIVRLVKDDFDFFWKNEDQFRRLRLPFRRGYLFHGPPGCGKSSMARYLQTSRCLAAYTLRFFDSHTDDNDLDRMFHHAAENAPSIVLLEDLDRIVPKDRQSKSHVSLQQLLNCLDGVGSAEGIVTIATANDPLALDPAILKRPGRFDRVVLFANPELELRHRYFAKMMPSIEEDELSLAAHEADGFSFAQLKECFVMAVQAALTEGRDVTGEDLLDSISCVRNAVLFGSLKAAGPGFGVLLKR